MSFQWIIDRAESISIDRKKVVASTRSRDGTTRAVSRGGQVWTFSVKVPDGIPWNQLRSYISQAEVLDRVTSGSIRINSSGQRWLVEYQGDSVNYTNFVATVSQGSPNITLTTSPTTSSGYKFRAGDFIQIGPSGKVYTVAADVGYNSNSVTLHRPVLETSGSYTLNVAENCIWTVICTQFPNWNLFARDQVSWDGNFIFAEVA